MNLTPVTVIGSCRVYEPLLRAGVPLAQAEVPAYTHNSKEVLQLLYLGRKGSPPDDTMANITRIPRGFQGFDVIPVAERFFVVEISSIRVLTYRGWRLQIHRFFAFCSLFSPVKMTHMTFSSEKELKEALFRLEGLPLDVDAISFYEQEEDELMADLREIYRALQGRVLFASHFDCNENGAPIWQRSRIRHCLARLREEEGADFFDPTPWMKEFGIERARLDQGHYTPPFETRVRELLCAKLQEVLPGSTWQANIA